MLALNGVQKSFGAAAAPRAGRLDPRPARAGSRSPVPARNPEEPGHLAASIERFDF